jgi:hypothetical protein
LSVTLENTITNFIILKFSIKIYKQHQFNNSLTIETPIRSNVLNVLLIFTEFNYITNPNKCNKWSLMKFFMNKDKVLNVKTHCIDISKINYIHILILKSTLYYHLTKFFRKKCKKKLKKSHFLLYSKTASETFCTCCFWSFLNT